MNVPKQWLIEEKEAVEERIKEIEECAALYDGDGYLPTANFLRKYVDMIDAEILRTKN